MALLSNFDEGFFKTGCFLAAWAFTTLGTFWTCVDFDPFTPLAMSSNAMAKTAEAEIWLAIQSDKSQICKQSTVNNNSNVTTVNSQQSTD